MIDQSYPVYASAIDSGKHFLFFRETVKTGVEVLSLGRKENEAGLFCYPKSITSP